MLAILIGFWICGIFSVLRYSCQLCLSILLFVLGTFIQTIGAALQSGKCLYMFLGRSLGSRPCGRWHLFFVLLITFNLFLNFYRLTWWFFGLFLFFLTLLLKQLLFHVVSQFLWVPLCIYFIHIFQLSFTHSQFSFLIKFFLGC